MKKYQIHTTLPSKHYEILKNNAEKYGSQQKVLELALERFENNPKPVASISPEKELWMKYSEINTACFIQKDGLKLLLNTVDIDQLQDHVVQAKPMEYQIENYYHKPLKECSLKEVIDGLIINANMSHWFDAVDCKDDGDYYTMKYVHSLGINGSQAAKILGESVFKTYGSKFQSTISEKTVFMKIYKTAG